MAAIPIRWGLGKLAERAAAAAAAAAAADAAKDVVKDKPDVKAREAECADTHDASDCNECRLGDGRVGQPPTPRYITRRTRINYDYQLQIANMYAGPERFGYVKRGDSADEIVNMDLESFKNLFGRGGEYTTLEWLFGGHAFDGFWRGRCTVVEAKANFDKFFDERGQDAKPFTFVVIQSWISSYQVQTAAVAPAAPQGRLEWHFMDASAFLAAVEAGLPPENVRHTPLLLGRI